MNLNNLNVLRGRWPRRGPRPGPTGGGGRAAGPPPGARRPAPEAALCAAWLLGLLAPEPYPGELVRAVGQRAGGFRETTVEQALAALRAGGLAVEGGGAWWLTPAGAAAKARDATGDELARLLPTFAVQVRRASRGRAAGGASP
jgi:hypothetical protein